MPHYLVQLAAESQAARRINNRDSMVVAAPDATTAKEVAKSWRSDDGDDKWDVASVTQLVEGLESDFSYRVRITFPGDTEPTEFLAPPDANFVALAAAMELLLEADPNVGANVSQVAGPPVAQTIGIGAGLGEVAIEADLLLNGFPIPGHVASVTAPAPGAPATARVIAFIDQSANDLAKLHDALTDEPL